MAWPADTPAPVATSAPPTAASQPTATQPPATHVVQAGETLFRIALNNGVTVEALRAANGITGDTIYAGQVLIIPGSQPVTASASAPTVTASSDQPPVVPSPTAVQVQWNTDPSALIIKAYSDSELAPYNGAVLIPEAQIWGDGHIIWVTPDGRGGRNVFSGALAQPDLQALLVRIVDAGFFTWEDNYQTYLGASLRPSYLTVSLSSQTKTVSEVMGAPAAYYEISSFIRAGAGVSGQLYIPARGYLTANAFPGGVDNAPEWPAAEAGFKLDQVGSGRYIDGPALQFAWSQVNKGPNAPVYVKSDGQIFVIMVQVPGVSTLPPP